MKLPHVLHWYYFHTDLSYPKDQSEAHLQHRIQFKTVLLILFEFHFARITVSQSKFIHLKEENVKIPCQSLFTS